MAKNPFAGVAAEVNGIKTSTINNTSNTQTSKNPFAGVAAEVNKPAVTSIAPVKYMPFTADPVKTVSNSPFAANPFQIQNLPGLNVPVVKPKNAVVTKVQADTAVIDTLFQSAARLKKVFEINTPALIGQAQNTAGVLASKYTQGVRDAYNNPVNQSIYNTLNVNKSIKDTTESILNPIDTFSKSAKEAGSKTLKNVQKEQQKFYDENGTPTGFQWTAEQVASNTPSFLASFGIGTIASVITKNPVVGYGLGFSSGFIQQTGQSYQDAKDYGVSDEQAENVSILSGVASGILEIAPIWKFIEKSPSADAIKKSFVKNVTRLMAEQYVTEGGTEALQQIADNALQLTYNENKKLFEGVPESFFIGGLMGAGAAGTFSVAGVNGQFKEGKTIEEANKTIETAINTDPKERTAEQKEIVDAIYTKELSPKDATNVVLSENLAGTEAGVKIIQAATQAENTGGVVQIKADEKTNEIEVKVLNKESSRPDHQTRLEQLINEKKDAEAQKLIDAIPDTDPYKESMQKTLDKITGRDTSNDELIKEVKKYKTVNDLIEKANTINPSDKGVFENYNPESRINIPLGDNIQTLDKSIGGSSDDMINIYRGSEGDKINAGDYITTNKQLAKDYAGNGNVLELKVRKGDVVDMVNEPGGEEYLYRPNADKEKIYTKEQLTELYNKANQATQKDVPSETPAVKKKVKRKSIKDYPSVESGLQSKGAEKIQTFELRKPPKPGTAEFKLHKKVVELIRKYAQSIGEGYTPRNALGVYFGDTKNIRINAINNVSVAAHEIAHFLDYANQITDRIANNADAKAELERMYLQYYPTASEAHPRRLKNIEGFATLLQKYTEQPTTISQEYPYLVNEFLMPDGKYYTKVIGDILTDLNQMIGEYQGLNALDKIGARVTSDNTNINKKSFLNFFQKLRTQIADEVYPMEILARKANVDLTKEDPSLWIRAYNSVSGIINNNISTKRGYWSFVDLQSGFQKKYDFNWRSLIESTQKRKITDSFSNYLVARREFYLYKELDQIKVEKDKLEMLAQGMEAVKNDEKGKGKLVEELKDVLKGYGIEVTDTDFDNISEKIKTALTEVTDAYNKQNDVLVNDAFDRKDVEEAYNSNKDLFKDEEAMFDKLVSEDLKTLNNEYVQLIDNDTYKRLSSKEGYASFKRQFYDEIVGNNDAPGSVKVGSTRVSSLIGRKGSQRTIINPLYSAIANHSEVTRKAMKQVVYNQIGKLGTSALMPDLMQVVPIKTALDGTKIIFPQDKDNNIVMARKNYKRLPVLMDSDIKATIDNLLTHQNIDVFTQLYAGMSRAFTAGTTALYPQFALTNFMVDQITATANSYNTFKPLYSPMKEMLNALRAKATGDGGITASYFEEYLVMGGERQTFTGWQKLSADDLFKRVNEEKSKMEKAISLVSTGTDWLSYPSAKSELFSRAAEYINARKAGKSQIVALEEAGRVTAPFHHIGSWGAKNSARGVGQTFIRGLPFFNATIQALDQTVRVAQTPDGAKRMTFVTIAITAAYLSAMMAMQHANDEQKEQYKDLEAKDLVNFIYYPNPNGNGLIRVKMNNVYSIPGTVINMVIAQKMFAAKYSAKDVMDAATAFLPDQFNVTDPTRTILAWIPQVFKPAMHVIFNVKEYPRVTSLVNMGLARKPEGLQFNEGTSAFAKLIGEKFNLSPIKIDYLLTGYFGRASGFLTGKPNIYDPSTSIMREYYFTMGKRVREFYEIQADNDKKYTAYQNAEQGFTNLSENQVKEIYRVKVITDATDDLLGEYRDIDVPTNQAKAAELRAKILLHITNLENKTTPEDFAKWSDDAAKRRYDKIEEKRKKQIDEK